MRWRQLIVALACAAGAHAAQAQTTYVTMGRLFTTPSERIQLDQQRNSLGATQPGAAAPATEVTAYAPPAAATPPAPPPAPVQLTGVVRRSDGRSTIWVNNTAQEAELRQGGPVPLYVGGQRVTLKPGQSYDAANGTVSEGR